MNDFEYDCLQKKRLAQQARYRRRYGKRKCTLSTDYMTQKQWKERCGVVLTINYNKPVSWDVFKELTAKTQEEYIRHLMDTYGANATSLAAMFDVQPLTVRRFLSSKELNISFPVGRSMNTEQKTAWEKFLKEEQDGLKAVESVPLTPVSSATIATPAVSAMNMKNVSMSFSGKIDVNAIANSLRHILGENMVGEIQIMCNLG